MRDAYRAKASSIALRVLRPSVSDVCMVHPISELDLGNGNPNGRSLSVWVVACVITGGVHDHSEDSIGQIDGFQAWHK